jgi:rfaE bifunctional protein kinase chain/domain
MDNKIFNKEIYNKKIKTIKELFKIIKPFPRNEKVIMCHGTFDVVHPGHIRHLFYAKSKAKYLIASLTSDRHIDKADYRPFIPEELRAINLAALEMVDYVLIDDDPTPINNIKIIKPDYFAKGFEYGNKGININTSQEIKALESYGGEIIFTPGDVVYSSSSIIESAPPQIKIEKLMVLMQSENISFKDLRKVISNFSNKTVHVIGDTIVDSFTYCSMIGGMAKTPTMSFKFEKKINYVGGAAIVAKHLKTAGANVTFTTVLGNDDLSSFVLENMTKQKINISNFTDTTRPTTNKNVIICDNYRLLKIDTLDNRQISPMVEKNISNSIKNIKAEAVIFSDFRHGIFNKNTIPGFVNNIPLNCLKIADSQVASRWGNILEFQNFDLITPNEKEARFALGDQDSVVRPLGLELYNKSKCKTLILKCGSRGLITYRSSVKNFYRSFFVLDSFAGNLVDPVGAGDALLAYSTLSLLVSKNEVVASIIGNIAAAIECESEGNVPVPPEKIIQKLDNFEKQTNLK